MRFPVVVVVIATLVFAGALPRPATAASPSSLPHTAQARLIDSWANGINEAGQIVGLSFVDEQSFHAVMWERGQVIDLGTLSAIPGQPGRLSRAADVNRVGQVVGLSTTRPAHDSFGPGTSAFLWEDGSVTELGALGP